MVSFRQKGDFAKTTKFLETRQERLKLKDLERFGREGVAALSSATPVDSGSTANSWYYEINRTRTHVTISFHNSNVVNNVPIAIIIQYGHGTGTGGYVRGRDYINPAIQPIFDAMAKYAGEEVSRL